MYFLELVTFLPLLIAVRYFSFVCQALFMSSTLQIRTLTEINEICFLYQRNMARSISVCQFLLFVIQYSTSNGHPRVGFVIITDLGWAKHPGDLGTRLVLS